MRLSQADIDHLLRESADHRCPGGGEMCVKIQAIADLPTRFGEYQIIAFTNCLDQREHAAVVHGSVVDREEVPVRLHSECLTGDALGSLRCDCRDQLIESLERIGRMDRGMVLYLRQEGRGIGFTNKIRAYQLQDAGFDTVQANEMLGFRPDERNYEIAARILGALHVRSIRILTNNPAKIQALQRYGVKIAGRVPVVIPPNTHDRSYLDTKRRKMGHLLDLEQTDDLAEFTNGGASDDSPAK